MNLKNGDSQQQNQINGWTLNIKKLATTVLKNKTIANINEDNCNRFTCIFFHAAMHASKFHIAMDAGNQHGSTLIHDSQHPLQYETFPRIVSIVEIPTLNSDVLQILKFIVPNLIVLKY